MGDVAASETHVVTITIPQKLTTKRQAANFKKELEQLVAKYPNAKLTWE